MELLPQVAAQVPSTSVCQHSTYSLPPGPQWMKSESSSRSGMPGATRGRGEDTWRSRSNRSACEVGAPVAPRSLTTIASGARHTGLAAAAPPRRLSTDYVRVAIGDVWRLPSPSGYARLSGCHTAREPVNCSALPGRVGDGRRARSERRAIPARCDVVKGVPHSRITA